MIDEIGSARTELAVDIGCGGGALTIPLAATAQKVVAVDISPNMSSRLRPRAAQAGVNNIEARVGPIEDLDFPPPSVELIVSNYALHHLLDRDKRALVTKAATWLRPGAGS